MRLRGKRVLFVGIMTGMFFIITILGYNSTSNTKSESSISVSSNNTELSVAEQYVYEENLLDIKIANRSDNTLLPGKNFASNQPIADEASEIKEQEKLEKESTAINSQEEKVELETKNNSDEIQSFKIEDTKKEEETSNIIIAQVDNYVNVRDKAGEEGNIIGKLYDESVGTVLDKKGDWLKIESGCVTGYVMSEFVLSGKKAEDLAEEVGQRLAKVTTTTLKVRKEPSLNAEVLGLVPEGDILTVSKELDGWVKVSVEEGDGYVSSDYVMIYTQNTLAESKKDEEARLKKEEAERQQAVAAANRQRGSAASEKNNSLPKEKNSNGSNSDIGKRIAEYALQFVGNPYVYGGTSLTNGADCSGFVQSVYKKFGISLPRTSGEQGQQGARIRGLENARQGDLIWYSGHIGIYIGNGKLVSASNSKPYPRGGIKVTNANYRPILSIRRIF